jgi:hypothetical protein
MRSQGTLVRIYDCGRSARSGQRSHPPTPRRPDHRASKPTRNPGSLDRLGVFFWCGSGREGVLLVLLASAQQFPTPREGWKGVPRSDRRDILVAISGLTYLCIVLQMARYTHQKKDEPGVLEKPRLAKVAVSPNEYMFRDWPLTPFAPIFPDDLIVAKRIGRQRGSAVERLGQMQEDRALSSEFPRCDDSRRTVRGLFQCLTRTSLMHFLIALCCAHNDISLYFACSFTSARQLAVACLTAALSG